LSYSRGILRSGKLAIGTFVSVLLCASPALAASNTRSAPTHLGARTLQTGMSGTDVAILQEDLTIAGIPTLSTGVFSLGTKVHVQTFQARYHVTADGVVGPATVKLIKRVVKIVVDREQVESRTGAASLLAATQMPTATTVSNPDPVTAAGSTTATSTTATGTSTTTAPTTPAADSGGTSMVPPPSDAAVEPATLSATGLAVAPDDAPMVIRDVIEAANQIAFLPYIYGGGHASFTSAGYDCSGSVSFALHGGDLLVSPLDSTQFETYGLPGAGRWITLWANGGHVYMRVAGLWFDTAGQSSANGNDRWSATRISPNAGFIEIHPAGW
jgi:cell wall-associated NlpC family hydrolase